MREEVILRLERNNRLTIAGELQRNKNETSSSALARWISRNGGLGRHYQAAQILTEPVVQVEYKKRYVIPSENTTQVVDRQVVDHRMARTLVVWLAWLWTQFVCYCWLLRRRKERNRFATLAAQKEYEAMVENGSHDKG